jgi:hypothetical protein
MGVGLALVLVFGLTFALMPAKEAKADEGDMQWLAQPGPGNGATFNVLTLGSDVLEFAVAADGATMYAIDGTAQMGANPAAAPAALYKSPNAGQQWIPIDLRTVADNAGVSPVLRPLGNVAVAPDNPNVVAISVRRAFGSTADEVFISTNGCITWTVLPLLAGTAATQKVVDLKVGPARGGTLLGREYLAATAGEALAIGGGGCLQIIGATAAWQDVGTGGSATLNTFDFAACEFSPGYVGDRIVVGVGTSTTPITSVFTYNTQSRTQLRGPLTGSGQIDAIATPWDLVPTGTSVGYADIAIPIDYDFTTPGFERLWASFGSYDGTLGNAFRCDGPLAPVSMQLNGIGIRSIAYSGTIVGGTLFAALNNFGVALATQIVYTTGATTNIPSWLPSFKPPTGNGAPGAYVRLSPNFLGDKTVYAGTIGANESAFSVSVNGGTTYNQESLVDQGVGAWGAETLVNIQSMWLTPDGKTLFVAADENPAAATQMSIWKTALPASPTSWERIYTVTQIGAGSTGLLAINKAEWDTKPELYLFDTATAAGANALSASYDGGNIFSVRSIPAAGIIAAAVESSKTLYIGIGTTVYKSTNGGLVWPQGPIASYTAAITSLVAAGGGHVLVGGPAGCSLSTDGGANFIPLPPYGLAAGGNFLAIPDEGYATNNLVYAADTAGGSIFRLDVVNGTVWDNLAPTPPGGAAKIGVAMSNGALYGMTATAFGADRTLGSHYAAGTITWAQMSVGAPGAGTNRFDVAQNHVYAAIGATAAIFAYNDYLATAVPVITSPASGATVPNDPVTGRALPITLSWNAMGTGTGLANTYLVFIWVTADGLSSARIYTTGNLGPFSTAPTVTLQNLATFPAPGGPAFVGISGVEYQWLVMAANQISTDAIDSPWSGISSFTVAEGIPQTEMVPPLTVPEVTVPVTVPPAEVVSPAWIWAVVIIGAILVIAVIALIFTTRRTP